MKNNQLLLGHGSGGKLTSDLISSVFRKYFSNEILNQQSDAAILPNNDEHIAYTTDSYVVDPIFFPGGNIGKLAICGTVNDLAVSGAKPAYISCGFIIEEGFPMDDLEKIVSSMAEEAEKAGVMIVTGDTKVVNKGKCDKIFINTSGIGFVKPIHKEISTAAKVSPGDVIIINGPVGDHGIAIMKERESLKFNSDIVSDCACLNHMISAIMDLAEINFMRDATRGGLASVVCELATMKNLGIELDETQIKINENVQGLCEIFGFDPLHVANEGKVILVAREEHASAIMNVMKKFEPGRESTIIGKITDTHRGIVSMKTIIGGTRIVDVLAGEQLPRIC